MSLRPIWKVPPSICTRSGPGGGATDPPFAEFGPEPLVVTAGPAVLADRHKMIPTAKPPTSSTIINPPTAATIVFVRLVLTSEMVANDDWVCNPGSDGLLSCPPAAAPGAAIAAPGTLGN